MRGPCARAVGGDTLVAYGSLQDWQAAGTQEPWEMRIMRQVPGWEVAVEDLPPWLQPMARLTEKEGDET